MDAYFFHEEQLLDLGNDDLVEEEDAEDVKLEGIDVPTWEKNNGLRIVPQAHKLEVLHQYHDSQVAGYWGRYHT